VPFRAVPGLRPHAAPAPADVGRTGATTPFPCLTWPRPPPLPAWFRISLTLLHPSQI